MNYDFLLFCIICILLAAIIIKIDKMLNSEKKIIRFLGFSIAIVIVIASIINASFILANLWL